MALVSFERLEIAMSKCTYLSTEIRRRSTYCESEVLDVISTLQNIVSRYEARREFLLKVARLPSAFIPTLDAGQTMDFMKVFLNK